MPEPLSLLRRFGPILLTVIAVVSVMRLRMSFEPAMWLLGEAMCQLVFLSIVSAGFARRARQVEARGSSSRANVRNITHAHNSPRSISLPVAGAVVLPIIVQIIERVCGSGGGLEIVMMSCVVWGALATAWLATNARTVNTAVICSGFLSLLATCSSDTATALIVAMLWACVCLAWLMARQPRPVQRVQLNNERSSQWRNYFVFMSACFVFVLSVGSVAGRLPPASRLGWQIMPTSGGSTWEDSKAHAGVGNGDAVVAAREHAASFGAVDSDVFADSEESSLFDLYSETFGEPFVRKSHERSVALDSTQVRESTEESKSQSDGPSSSLTTQRTQPTKSTQQTKPSVSEALFFWIGRANQHLPLERFDAFDGIEWTKDNTNVQPIQALEVSGKTWMHSVPIHQSSVVFTGTAREAVKIARLKSPAIPTASGLKLWHIDKVNDPSMFEMNSHDCLSMPGRERVPEYTIVRFVHRLINGDYLESRSTYFGSYRSEQLPSSAGQLALADWLKQHTSSHEFLSLPSWHRLQFVLSKLKSEFVYDASWSSEDAADPLEKFVRTGRGNSLMFATAAAIAIRQLGFNSRLTTGFLAKGEHRIGFTNEIAFMRMTHTPGWNWRPLPMSGFRSKPLRDFRSDLCNLMATLGHRAREHDSDGDRCFIDHADIGMLASRLDLRCWLSLHGLAVGVL